MNTTTECPVCGETLIVTDGLSVSIDDCQYCGYHKERIAIF